MRKEKESECYETRYKHKLNMLEPGTVMLKWIGGLELTGFGLFLFQLKISAYIAFGLGGMVFLVLLVLLALEAHQDRRFCGTCGSVLCLAEKSVEKPWQGCPCGKYPDVSLSDGSFVRDAHAHCRLSAFLFQSSICADAYDAV